MKILRVFIKPDGRHICDVPLTEGQHMLTIYDSFRRDGALVSAGAIVPLDSILYVSFYEITEPHPGPQIVPFKPVS